MAQTASTANENAIFREKLRYLRRAESTVVDRGTRIDAVLAQMRARGSGGVLICQDAEGNNLAGIFTHRDYLDKIAGVDVDGSIPIENFMTPSPKTLSPDSTVGDAIRFMTEGGYRHCPLVSSGGTIFGLLSVRDVVDFIAEHFPEEVCNHPPRLHQRIRTQEGG